MAGYIGSKSSVTLVDGYNEAEADAEFVTKTGDSMTGNLSLGDNNKAIFGAGSDLQIYHDGTHSYVDDSSGTGRLILKTDYLEVQNAAGNEAILGGIQDGAVSLFYNGNTKLATTSTGIDVTGTVTSDGLTVTQSGSAFTPSSQTVALFQRNSATGSGAKVCILSGNNSSGDLNFGDAEDEDIGKIAYEHNNNAMTFTTNTAERMRLDSSGNLLVGTATADPSGVNGVQINGGSKNYFVRDSTAAVNQIHFRNPNGTVGKIMTSGSSTSYNTSSDYRLKENVVDLTGASARVNQLNPSRFNFISDETNTLVDGFLAHEVATVVPEAITGTKDAMMDEEYEVTPAVLDDDGNVTTEAVMGTRSVPNYQGIDQSKLVPLLTAALQEALTEIASLKTRVEALEA